MQAQSDTSYQISLIRHEKPLQKIKFPYTQVMVNKVANPRNIKRQGWWWYHLVTGRSRKPPILPYLNLSTIANLPTDSFFHYLLSCQDATPCIRGITTQLCLDEITVRKILCFEHSVQQGLPSHLQPPPLLAKRAKLNCFNCLNPIPLWDLGVQSLSQLIQAILHSSFFCPHQKFRIKLVNSSHKEFGILK